MVLCIIGLVVFGILGIFSAKYRQLAREAFECVFRMAQFKPCQGGFDDKIRREILSKAFQVHPSFAKYVNRYFGLLSWIFVVSFVISLFFTGQGIYNYAIYGNCNGPQGGFCIFDPFGGTEPSTSGTCPVVGAEGRSLNYPEELGKHNIGPTDAKVALVEVGCFNCPYTKQAEPIVKQILIKYSGKIKFVFKHLPLLGHPFANESVMAADCADEKGKFWEYKDLLFENQDAIKNEGVKKLAGLAGSLGLDKGEFEACIVSGRYMGDLETELKDGIRMGIYGTPTFFVNQKAVVGPQSFETLSSLIDAELKSG